MDGMFETYAPYPVTRGHCESRSLSEAEVSSSASSSELDESFALSFSGDLIGSGTASRLRSFLPVILPTMPEMVICGLISAAEPVYPRSSNSLTTSEAM